MSVKKDDTVRAAVMAALLEGQTVSAVARKLKLSKATVSRIKTAILPAQLKQTETEKRDKITVLIETHLETALGLANELATKTIKNDNWVAKQPAGEVAVFYGVLTDKAFRILEAAQPLEEAEDTA